MKGMGKESATLVHEVLGCNRRLLCKQKFIRWERVKDTSSIENVIEMKIIGRTPHNLTDQVALTDE